MEIYTPKKLYELQNFRPSNYPTNKKASVRRY